MDSYKKLEAHFADYTALKQIDVLIDWDRSVMMPEKGVEQRARQAAVLNVKMHEILTDPRVGEWIAAVDRAKLDPWQQANLRVIEWMHNDAVAVPADLVSRKLLQETRTEMIWRKAKAENDFAAVAPELQKLLDLVREFGAVKAARSGLSVYDALMEPYSPGMLSADVDPLFEDLAAFLSPFITAVTEQQEQPIPLSGPFAVEAQKQLCWQVAEMLGFEKGWGRLDVSSHPFSMGIGNDVRITTRYDENDFTGAIQCVAHEAGHGLYDHHTPEAWHHQPVGASQNMGLAIHESQSLSLDMQLSRGLPFWQAVAQKAQKAFGRQGADLSAENLARHAARVERSFIRVEADEVTYPAHIIFRYRLEKQMIAGKLAVKDLPQAWAAEMKSILGVAPPDDRRGCLQDIHWYAGMFGYFPAYALGAIIAAQYADKMRRDIPDLDARLARGEFTAQVGWLKDNVQSKGCLFTPVDLVREATGEKMTVHYFKKHLTERYMRKATCSDTSAQGARHRA